MIFGTLYDELSGLDLALAQSQFESQLKGHYENSPAIIIEGIRGNYAKATLALTALITKQRTIEDCKHAPEILLVVPEKEGHPITLEQVELIQRHFLYKTNNNTPLVAVIPYATTLSIAVQNALLKTAEELQAPHHIIFGVEQSDQLLPTIQSRCRVLSIIGHNEMTDADVTLFWREFLAMDIAARKKCIDTHFSKKTKKGQENRNRIEDYLIGLQEARQIHHPKKQRTIEYFRKICHTVNSQMIIDSFLFL